MPNPDLTKLAFHSAYPGFHNNRIYTGNFVLPDSNVSSGGVIQRTFDVTLDNAPDIIETLFNQNGTDVWFKSGNQIIVQDGTQSGFSSFLLWDLDTEINGTTLTITASAVKTFTATFNPDNAITVNYRVIDYSSL